MKQCLWLVVLTAAAATACQQEQETLETFQKRWQAMATRGQYEQLYPLLDNQSRQGIRRQLEVLRGLDPAAQKSVLRQLGQDKPADLRGVTAAQYFAMLWQKATQGKEPRVDAASGRTGTADMILTYDGSKRMHIRLVQEGGRWSWLLPDRSLVAPLPDG